jgi:hypothetical protein
MDDILFNFPNFGLSDDESESKLSLTSNSNREEKEQDNKWYNILFNSDSDLDDKASSAPFILLRSSAISASTSDTSTPIRKEYSIRTRIRALTIINNKIPMARIIKITGIS